MSNYYLKLGSTLDGGHLAKKHNQAKDWEKAEFITCSKKEYSGLFQNSVFLNSNVKYIHIFMKGLGW